MLTLEQEVCNYHTFRHIERVRNLINILVKELLDRAAKHDQSKLESPEVELFAKYTSILKGLEYGSSEYKQILKEFDVAIQHHYAKNDHHPEHFPNGIDDMNLCQITELFCDWKAASERHNTGNILKSIEINADRYNLCPQLIKIFQNTAKFLEGK